MRGPHGLWGGEGGGGRSRGVGREEEGQSHRTPAGPRGQDVCSLHCLGETATRSPGSGCLAHLPDRGAPLPGGDPAGLTSRGEQVAVEGDVSLAHGQEVCTDIWGDKRAAMKRRPFTSMLLPAELLPTARRQRRAEWKPTFLLCVSCQNEVCSP